MEGEETQVVVNTIDSNWSQFRIGDRRLDLSSHRLRRPRSGESERASSNFFLSRVLIISELPPCKLTPHSLRLSRFCANLWLIVEGYAGFITFFRTLALIQSRIRHKLDQIMIDANTLNAVIGAVAMIVAALIAAYYSSGTLPVQKKRIIFIVVAFGICAIMYLLYRRFETEQTRRINVAEKELEARIAETAAHHCPVQSIRVAKEVLTTGLTSMLKVLSAEPSSLATGIQDFSRRQTEVRNLRIQFDAVIEAVMKVYPRTYQDCESFLKISERLEREVAMLWQNANPSTVPELERINQNSAAPLIRSIRDAIENRFNDFSKSTPTTP